MAIMSTAASAHFIRSLKGFILMRKRCIFAYEQCVCGRNV